MIVTNELRRLAQVATPGPWEVYGLDQNGQAIIRGEHIEIATCWHHCVESIEKEMHANAAFIAAANPAAVSELLDRLEAAEKAVTEAYQRGYETGQEEIAAERDTLRAENAALIDDMNLLRNNNTALRAKIEQMERQEPVAFALYSGWALKSAYHKEHEACDQRDRRQLSADLGGSLEAYRVVPLYALPGAQAQPAPDRKD